MKCEATAMIMEYYPARKMSEIMPYGTTWIKLEGIFLVK